MAKPKLFPHSGLICLALIAGAAGCTQSPVTPPGATASASFNDQLIATVAAIDRPRRILTLQSADGDTAQVGVTDAVRNFDRIEKGDKVRLTVHTRVVVTAAGNAALPGVIVDERGGTAPLGSKPAGVWAARAQRSVQIVSVDRATHSVAFREPDGRVGTIVVQNPENYALADGLQPGSFVTVVRTDAVAVSVDKV